MTGKHAVEKMRSGPGLRTVLYAFVIFLIGAAVIWFLMHEQETAGPKAVARQTPVAQCTNAPFTVAVTPELAVPPTTLLKANCPGLSVVGADEARFGGIVVQPQPEES